MAEAHPEGTDEFLRAMLLEGPFPQSSRYAYLNCLAREYGADAPPGIALPPVPQRFRKRKHVCSARFCARSSHPDFASLRSRKSRRRLAVHARVITSI